MPVPKGIRPTLSKHRIEVCVTTVDILVRKGIRATLSKHRLEISVKTVGM